MKAIYKSTNPFGLELGDVEPLAVGPRDAKIKVLASSICGSDLPVYYWDDPWTMDTIKPGQIIGHEFCGEIVEIGDNPYSLKIGDYVSAEGHISCGECFHCRSGLAHICPSQKLLGFTHPGAFAEYLVVPAKNIIKLPPSIKPKFATILDPIGNAVHATLQSTNLANKSVLVTGAGPVGLFTIVLAKLSGASSIVATDIHKERLDIAKNVGADVVLNPEKDNVENYLSSNLKRTNGVDVFFEMSGSASALIQGFSALRPGGEAILLGLPKEQINFDFANLLVGKGITVHGIIGRLQFSTWEIAIDIIPKIESSLEKIVTHELDSSLYKKGFELMKQGECGKIVLTFN